MEALSRWKTWCGVAAVAVVFALQGQRTWADDNSELAGKIQRLVAQLNDDRAAVRDQAEEKLIELAGQNIATSDRFLELLPEPNDQMPLAVRERLERIRLAVEEKAAKAAVEATTLTLSGNNLSLADVIAEVEKQTGNKLLDRREQFGADPNPVSLSLDLKNEPFWSALDQILDQANLSVYNFGGEDSLTLVARDPDEAPRVGRGSYSGPFRWEVLEVQSQRNLRYPDRQALSLQLEISWEPRLRPIAISLPMEDLVVTNGKGERMEPLNPDAVLDVEVPGGSQATELIIPLVRPPRSVTEIASFAGKAMALVPGRRVTFRFDDIQKAVGQTQRRGGVQVTLEAVRKNNAIWEVFMRLRLDEDNDALASHRGWVYQNPSYLVGKDGQPIDNAGYETTMQTENEVGFAYFFDVEGDLAGLTWVYETPAAIVSLPVSYELKEIELP